MKRCMSCMREYGDAYEICPHCGYAEGTPPKEIYFLKPGTVLQDRYVIGTSVGSGGFGIVYRAWDRNLAKVVAVKEFFPLSFASRSPGQMRLSVLASRREEFAKELKRFLEEARYLAKFSSHPNIINVYSFFEANNTAYIDMEFLEGVSYKDYIRRQGGRVPAETAVSVTASVLGALREIHREHIIHRDVSPDNIFICKDGRIKLMDFGAARFSKEDESNYTIILKPGYAPPEQYQSKSRQGAFTDIYAVGAVLYRSVTGEKPCESTNRIEAGADGDELKAPRELAPEISETLNNVILRAMALQPELRFQTDDEFLDALKPSSEGKIRGVAEELRHRKKRRLLFAGAAAALLLVGGLIGYRVYDDGRSRIELKPASLQIWVSEPETEGASSGETYGALLENALAEYRERYPQIELSVTRIPEGEYEERLREARRSGRMPEVYEAPEDTSLRGQDLTRVYSYLDEGAYLGLSEVRELYPDGTVCPVTFAFPVVYRNRAEDYDGAAAAEEYRENLSDGSFDVDADALEEFLGGGREYILADTSAYWEVQRRMGGRYEMREVPEAEEYAAFYKLAFCVGEDADKAQVNAAIQCLYYLLGENAQSSLCIEGHSDLPMNRAIYETFEELNVEFAALEGVSEHLEFASASER